MAGNYEKGMYHQLMHVMARLNRFEYQYEYDTTQMKDTIAGLISTFVATYL